MRRAECVILAFGAFGEAREATALAERSDAIASPGQDFVRIRLMTDVPDQTVLRRVEHVMQRNGELHHAKAGAEMTPGDRHGADRLAPELFGEARELVLRKLP